MWGWLGLAVAAVGFVFLMGADPSRIPAVGVVVQTAAETQPSASDDKPIANVSTELKADRRGHYFTDAEIDGTTVKVMVDTGASAVALSYEDADDVGLRPRTLDFDVPVGTANGVVNAARVSLRRVEIDGIEVRDVEGLVLPEGVLEGTLLGMSFLSRLRSFKVEDGVLYLED
jgi:aspartyl protease family protein